MKRTEHPTSNIQHPTLDEAPASPENAGVERSMSAAGGPPKISIVIRAWNEEKVIRRTLESVFSQSLFERLSERGERCEVICIPNGCTDRTADIAAQVIEEQSQSHPFRDAFSAFVAEIEQAGRNNTWNAFVHSISNRDAEFLFIMDSDIVFNERETLFNMYAALLDDEEAMIASDRQIKDIALKKNKTLLDRISLSTSDMTRTIEGQITGQLYCIRAATARRLYLPKDLGAPDDGFIKAVVCSDFFTRRLSPHRITVAENASHIFEAYVSPREVLNNQKRQMIGQTTVHVLVEKLRRLPIEKKLDLATTLREMEEDDPDWLKKAIQRHLKRTRFFWRIFPNALSFRFARWWKMRGWQRVKKFPATLAGFAVTMIACARARRHFVKGQMHYWPKASREKIQHLELGARQPQPTR